MISAFIIDFLKKEKAKKEAEKEDRPVLEIEEDYPPPKPEEKDQEEKKVIEIQL